MLRPVQGKRGPDYLAGKEWGAWYRGIQGLLQGHEIHPLNASAGPGSIEVLHTGIPLGKIQKIFLHVEQVRVMRPTGNHRIPVRRPVRKVIRGQRLGAETIIDYGATDMGVAAAKSEILSDEDDGIGSQEMGELKG